MQEAGRGYAARSCRRTHTQDPSTKRHGHCRRVRWGGDRDDWELGVENLPTLKAIWVQIGAAVKRHKQEVEGDRVDAFRRSGGARRDGPSFSFCFWY